jgi:imidazolonepropionase-like amidohydrolase
MKPLDTLKAGTSVDADLLGVANRKETLEPGKVADIVAVPGNPAQNIRHSGTRFLGFFAMARLATVEEPSGNGLW